MSTLTSIEKRYFEDIFAMGSGYVISQDAYNNAKFAEFFRECAKVDISSDKYSFNGDSKAKRLRAFWEVESDRAVGTVLEALLQVWSYENPSPDEQSKVRYNKALGIVRHLQGKIADNVDTEATFLKQQFEKLDVDKIGLDGSLLSVIQHRLEEVQKCLQAGLSLSAIFMAGSILEGILLSVASKNPKTFNQSKSAPIDKEQKVRPFHEWSLAQFIDVAHDVGFLKRDVKQFSHELRDFRNYIHPGYQAASNFQPTKHTSEICLQVLKAAIADLGEER